MSDKTMTARQQDDLSGPDQASIRSWMPRLGELLLIHGLITEAQLQEAVHRQQTIQPSKPIGEVLVGQQAITPTQLRIYLEKYHQQLQLGDALIATKLITESQLREALVHQRHTGLPLGTVLMKLNYISESVLKRALEVHLSIPCINLTQVNLDRSLARLFNQHYAQRHHIVPVSREGAILTLAMDDPLDTAIIGELQRSTGLTIHAVTATYEAIGQAIRSLYGDVQKVPEVATNFEVIAPSPDLPTGISPYTEESHENPRADELVRYLISLAIHSRASDVHLECIDQRLCVRFRLDGMLQDIAIKSLEQDLNANQHAIVSRIKILGKLDIAEKRRPQDGSFRAHMVKDGKLVKIDFRISIVPGYYGENVVLRILDPRNAPQSLDQLNFWQPITAKLHQLLQRTTGLLLITGPTGSGKSTTLYAALKKLYRPEIKVLTAENPVEYVYDEFTQCQVNEKIGNTFASYLRAFLRHDPEVIMIGEIRDEETAEMALRAAQTGHFVLSTLHANDAIGAIPRLLDLKVDANLMTSCLLGVLAQRLARKVCPDCKEAYVPSPDLVHQFFEQPPADMCWYKGRGCSVCKSTGYKGRMVIAELWTPSDEDIVLINKAAPFDAIKQSSYQSTLLMAEDVWEKLRAGQTNLEELIRILPYASIHQFRSIVREGNTLP